jgi:gluconokinase
MVEHHVFVIMGAAGSGKSTIGIELAEALHVPFADGDSFHSEANITKMAGGVPLDDEDRAPWLDAIGVWLDSNRTTGGVVACSALKRAYRDRLRAGRTVRFVYLHGTYEQLAERLQGRRDHFFQPKLLDSQLATLEAPTPDEHVLTVPIELTPAAIVKAILQSVQT